MQATAFSDAIHVGQLNTPTWSQLETTFSGIFERHYFANNGPLVRDLDRRVAQRLGVRHAVSVTNGTVGLLIALRALGLKGEVIVPSFTFRATVQAVSWAGLTPVFCDVEPTTHNLSAETVLPRITEDTCGILAVHLWGRPCDVDRLEALAEEKGLQLLFDAAHGFGASHRGSPLGAFGRAEVFSFHATKVLNGAEGGCITTNDDDLADVLRAMRSFHDSETPADLRINGKMSEAQAAMAHLGLDALEDNLRHNELIYRAYERGLQGANGLSLVRYDASEANTYQYVVVDVDARGTGLSRDAVLERLRSNNVLARRYFEPVHRMSPFMGWYGDRTGSLPSTDELSKRLLQLPNSSALSEDDVARICAVMRRA